MQTNEVTKLIESLRDGIVTVTFKKINTDEIRVMPCSLDPKVLTENGVTTEIKSFDPASDHLVAWALDKKAWRSFRLSTVISWEVTNA